MSQALSNLSLSLPLSSRSSISGSRNFYFLKTNGAACNSSLKAMAADSRENLDHLQRASKHRQQTQPKKRVAPVAPVGLWDRFPTARTVHQMLESMERMMEDPIAYSSGWPSAPQSPINGSEYGGGRTPWEIKEGESAYKMRFDMPGMTKEDVKVWVEENMLVVKAEKVPKKKSNGGKNGEEEEEEEEEEEWSAKSYGKYSSRIALPENIQFEKIKAEVKDGVLYITIPKASTTGKILDIHVQ